MKTVPAKNPIARQEIYNGRIIQAGLETFKLPSGKQITMEVARHIPAAAVVPVSDQGEILLVHQFRPVINQWVWEIPAGMVDPGEAPQDCANRELIEETGWKAKKIEPLIPIYTAFGFTDELIHIYKATGLEKAEKNLDENEVLEEHFFSLTQITEMLKKREIVDSKTIIGLTYLILDL